MALEAKLFNEDIEKTVLGIMIMDSRKCVDAISQLDENDFYIGNVSNRAIFRTIKSLSFANQPVDLHTVVDELNKAKILDSVGGLDYVVSLTELVTGVSNLQYYVDTLKEYSLARKLLNAMSEIEKDIVKTDVKDLTKFIGLAENKITSITQERKVSDFKASKDIANQVGTKLQLINSENASQYIGITTGFRDFDNCINGLQKANLIVLAARPSVGKSALGMNIAFNAAKNTNRPVAFFSTEMASSELVTRLFSCVSGVPLKKIHSGFLSKDDKSKLFEAQNIIADTNLYFDDTSNIPLEDLIAKAKKLKNDKGDLALIVVDYIGLVKVTLKGNENTVREISEVTKALKALSKDLDVPVLALAQVNRKVEDRENAKPELSNLKDSGSIEQDADQVIFIYNPTSYIAKKKKNDSENKEEHKPQEGSINDQINNGIGEAEVIQLLVKKNRNGPLKDEMLLFFKDIQRFESPTKEAKEQFYSYFKN